MHTSCFASLKKIPAGLDPVSIARGQPAWFKGRRELRLAPRWSWLKMSREAYDYHFRRLLERLDPQELYDDLGENAVLLCWEAPGIRCHRRWVAEWLEQALQIEVPELGFDRADCPPFADLPSKGELPASTVKALSVRQPAASEIASGEKRIEYRSWSTDYRGELLIVASKRPVVDDLPAGVAVCLVTLVDCTPDRDEPGLWKWRLENPRPVQPVPIRGQLGLFSVQLSAVELL